MVFIDYPTHICLKSDRVAAAPLHSADRRSTLLYRSTTLGPEFSNIPYYLPAVHELDNFSRHRLAQLRPHKKANKRLIPVARNGPGIFTSPKRL